MELREFESSLYHQLFDFFYDHGFEMMAGKKQFRKIIEPGFQNVIFLPTEYEGEIWLEVSLGVRHEAVEEIAQQFLETFQDFKRDSNTVIISIGKFTNNKYFRYKVYNKDDLELVAQQVIHFLEVEGLSFMDKCSNIGYLDKAFNTKPRKPCKYLYNQSHRCFKGIIMARLNRNAKYDSLNLIYQGFLEQAGNKPQTLGNYGKLIQFLSQYNAN